MCGNNWFGGNNCWWIIILILLISCCGTVSAAKQDWKITKGFGTAKGTLIVQNRQIRLSDSICQDTFP